LGNIWRFPYMMGKYGGSAFLLLYVLIVLAFGIPALMAEYALGRHTRRGPLGAFRMARLPGAKFCGGLLLLTIFMAASYYGTILAMALQRATSFTIAAASPGSCRLCTSTTPIPAFMVRLRGHCDNGAWRCQNCRSVSWS